MTQQARLSGRKATRGNDCVVAQPPSPAMIVVGQDVLELLSSAMYVDPLSIYREYVQNAADAIDEARENGLLRPSDAGEVGITVDTAARRIVIRDNGAGIPVDQAAQRLLAIGASGKRGTAARGFRGVGRLAGLAYGRSLTFRTRSSGDGPVFELRWDCQRLKAALREVTQSDDISSVIQRVVTISHLDGDDWPKHFFEVELNDVVRTKRDSLLSPTQIGDYLEQVAPVPFSAEFTWSDAIASHLSGVRLGELEIAINGEAPLWRPLRDNFKVTDAVTDEYRELELITLTDLDGGIAAKGWLLHHGYRGSITIRSRIAGLRARVGNVQIGDENLLDDVLPEARFNGWTVGEIHILDPRIVPNARRDHFEQNVHFSNLTAQLEPLGRQIAKRARAASVARNRARLVEAPHAPAPTTRQSVEAESSVDVIPDAAPTEHRVVEATSQLSTARASLSLKQRQTLKKVRAILNQSGLSSRERAEIIAELI